MKEVTFLLRLKMILEDEKKKIPIVGAEDRETHSYTQVESKRKEKVAK